MSPGRYLIGLLLGTVALAPVCVGARRLRGRVLPGWWGPPALLGDIVIGLAIVVGTSELLGLIGLFRLAPMVAGLAAAGGMAWYVGRRNPVAHEAGDGAAACPEVPPARLGRGASVVAVAATAVVAAEWSTRTIEALRHGPIGIDTLWYHLPFAARFVQEGSITAVHYTDGDALAASFPSNSALLHGLGIMLLGNDVLSPVLNLGFLALALLAGWCIGRPFGVAPATLTCLAVVLGTPSLVATQPGGGYNDVVGIAVLLAAAALLLATSPSGASPHRGVIVVAALGAGLALGTKYQFIAPVAALTVGVLVLAPRGRRVQRGALWLLPGALTGGFWYVRNLVAFDNPLPAVGIELGPLTLPGIPSLFSEQASLTEYAFDDGAWSKHLVPGLTRALGPVWWAVLALAAAGIVLGAIVGRNRTHRMLAFVGIASFAAFVMSPAIHDVDGEPRLFASDVRYAAFLLALGIVLLPITFAPARVWWPLATAGVVLVATQLDATIWPTGFRDERFVEPIRGVEPLAGLAVGVVVLVAGVALLIARTRRPGWRPSLGAALPLVAVFLVAGFGVQHAYLDDRYTNTPPIPKLYGWARHVSDERIGVTADFLFLQYPFYGKDLSNHVQYIGRRGRHGAFFPISKCEDWRRELNAGRYSYVVTATDLLPNREAAASRPGPYAVWTDADPAATLVRREVNNLDQDGTLRFGYVGYSLFRIDGPLDPAGCNRLAPEPRGPHRRSVNGRQGVLTRRK